MSVNVAETYLAVMSWPFIAVAALAIYLMTTGRYGIAVRFIYPCLAVAAFIAAICLSITGERVQAGSNAACAAIFAYAWWNRFKKDRKKKWLARAHERIAVVHGRLKVVRPLANL